MALREDIVTCCDLIWTAENSRECTQCALSHKRGHSKGSDSYAHVNCPCTILQALENGFDLVRRANLGAVRSLLGGGTHPPFTGSYYNLTDMLGLVTCLMIYNTQLSLAALHTSCRNSKGEKTGPCSCFLPTG